MNPELNIGKNLEAKLSESKTPLLWKRFCEHNKAAILAKFILSDRALRGAQIKSVVMVLEDGTEFEIDSIQSKAFKKFKQKLKAAK